MRGVKSLADDLIVWPGDVKCGESLFFRPLESKPVCQLDFWTFGTAH
jgi:hypothetical protein